MTPYLVTKIKKASQSTPNVDQSGSQKFRLIPPGENIRPLRKIHSNNNMRLSYTPGIGKMSTYGH